MDLDQKQYRLAMVAIGVAGLLLTAAKLFLG